MTDWKILARKYLGSEVKGVDLKTGDVLIGFHSEPFKVVTSDPRPHPTRDGWVLVDMETPYGTGTAVFTDGESARIGKIPLTRTDANKYFPDWRAPCGCVVSTGEHCSECGPYNAHSALCVNNAASTS